jgi:PAS domain S-box-containing protein
MMHTLFSRFDFRLSTTYFIVAVLWILLSDNVVNLIFGGNPSLLATMNILKGWAFVAATTVALFTVLRAELRKRDAMEVALQNDIHERTRTLEALEASEHRFAAIFHGSPVATGISRRSDAHIVDVNDAFVAMFGYERAELIGRTSMEVGLWVQPEKRADAIGVITEKGYLRNLELLARSKTGNLINLLGSSRAIELEKVAHLVSMFYDVTEQRKLQEQSHYQALLLTNVSDAVISTDTDFNIRSWNPAAEAIYGWSAEEVIGSQSKRCFKENSSILREKKP